MLDRIACLLMLVAVAGAAFAEPPATAPSAPSAPSAPLAFHGGGPLLGQADALPPPPMTERWAYKTSETDPAEIEGAAIISGGAAYVGDANGVVHAIDLASGKSLWQYKAEDGFASTPALVQNHLLIGDLGGKFHCIAADTGKRVWIFDADSPIHCSANATIVNGRAHVLFGNDAGAIFCLDAKDGKKIWDAHAGDRVNGAPAIANGAAYFSGCDAQLRAISIADGKEIFCTELGALSPGSPAVLNDRIIVGADGGHVLCFSLDGKRQLWSYAHVANDAMVYASPAVMDGIAVIGARDRSVHAIQTSTGKPLWTFKTRGDVDSSPVISAGRVYVGSRDKKLYVLDLKTGQKIWEFPGGRGYIASPAIANGLLVIGDTRGTVHCLQAAP